MKRRIAIIGAGLAGLAAAIRLIESDHQPIVIETRRKLGGRATSFDDQRSGEVLDNCQHVLLGCCTNLMDFYDRLGVLDLIQWHRELHWTAGRGEIDRLKAGWLPAPLHLSGSFLRMRLLTFPQKRQVARAMRLMMRLGADGRRAWQTQTFVEFLRECGQDEALIRRFWNVIIVSACNLEVDRVNAAAAIQVFQEGFLANRFAYAMGLSTVPLAELYEPAAAMITQAGGQLQLGVSAKGIAFDGNRVTGVVTDEGVVAAAAVISSVPFDRLEKLTSQAMREADVRLTRLGEFEVSPILGVHLWFDQRIMAQPHLVVVDPPHGVQWLFNKGVDERGAQHVHAVISAAQAWMELSEQQIVERVVEDVHRALPVSVGLAPLRSRTVKEKRATFAPTPAVERLRPGVAPGYVGVSGGGIANLFLAGDWVDTGWPATMEGAVRSGYAAAAAVTGDGGVVADVPASWLSRKLGLR